MKAIVSGGMVRALIALGLVSYHAVPALAVGQTANVGAQTQWVSQLIVKEKSGSSGTYQLQSAATRVDVATVQRWSAAAQLPMTYKRAMSGGAHVVTLPQTMSAADAQAVAQRMEASGQFEYVAPDRILHAASTPSDPLFQYQWNLLSKTGTVNNVVTVSSMAPANGATTVGGANVTTAWDTTKGASSVNVAVLDTGILPGHPDLSGAQIKQGYDFVTDPFMNNKGGTGRSSDPTDPGDWVTSADITNNSTICGGRSPSDSSWHGTFVTGQLIAQHNSKGVAGIAPGVSLLMARVLGKCGGATSDVVDALTWATGGTVSGVTTVNTSPAKVVNMSLGGVGSCDTPTQNAISAARARGAAIVVATGNDGNTTIGTPANCAGTIAVTAHTFEGDRASYANVGTGTTLSAPGGGNGSVVSGLGALVPSLTNDGTTTATTYNYTAEGGTSMATPHVAGVAALLLSINNALTPAQITTILQQSARPFPAGTYCATHAGVCGAGMLDAGDAVSVASGKPLVHAATSASSITANNAVTLTASGTPGFGSTTASVQWTQTSGPTASLTTAGPDTNGNYTATFTPTAAGTYAFNVTWTNGTGGTATDSTQVSVAAAPASGGGTGGGSTGGSTGGGTGTTTPATTSSSGGGGGGAIGLGGAALLLAAGLAGRRRRVK
ncbi:S8 family serine peptidase [Ralstonia insidiosa]|uniref:Peptidase S8 n=1 Tax=Ralstonia insidiosa TaxID=190721 RepID=A0A191ZZK7_9RALS|nr:S8 family serine peptidase [Ralstonia insidiosa]ANJ73492.1 peptidase S8 [Ralstonia insidiosa]KAB0473870.1 S8 family serine peptidase [Ralstonia insidiosa]MBY4912183.1 S8 family serine peptidase [Ralstonia insidiosa]